MDDATDLRHELVTVTVGANNMIIAQFTQTEQNYTDLRRYIDHIRAEHVAFVQVARWVDDDTTRSSEEL